MGAALASSLNIGTAIYNATDGETLTEPGHMPLNCLIFQDDIKRLNSTLDQARKGAALIGETLAQKRLKLNHGKSSHIMKYSPEEKSLGDQIHTEGSQPASLVPLTKEWVKLLANSLKIPE